MDRTQVRPRRASWIVWSIIGVVASKYQRSGMELSSTALDAMLRHAWPGNVRELRHSVERAVLLADGLTIDVEHLGLRQPPEGSLSLENMELDEAERILIRKALTRNRGNVTRAAGRSWPQPKRALPQTEASRTSRLTGGQGNPMRRQSHSGRRRSLSYQRG